MQNGFSNPLLRHIQRYARATTIFRAADWDAISAQSQTENLAPQPVRASWQSAPTSLPVGKAIEQAEMLPPSQSSEPPLMAAAPPMHPVESELTAVNTPAITTPAPHAFAGADTSGSLPLVNTGGQAIPETTTAPAPTPTVQRTATNQGGGSNWNRLQRIMAKHDNKTSPAVNALLTGGLGNIVASTEIDSHVTTEPPIERAIADAESTAPPPLESVWPVQQKPLASPKMPTVSSTGDSRHHSTQTATLSPPQSSPTTPSNLAEAETVRAKLNDVSAARRTDSSVELHLPRRPRPAHVLQPKQSTESANESFWNRMRSSGTQPEKVSVPTEIGPLPADMWETLGEVPPIQSIDGDSSASDAIQRAMAAAEISPAMPTQPAETIVEPQTVSTPSRGQAVSPPTPPDTIQRAAAAAETIPTITPQSTPVQSQTAAPPPTPSAPDAIQRAATAAETSPTIAPQSTPVQSQTAPTPSRGQAVSPSTPSEPDGIQRAVAAAETTPTIAPQPTPVQSQTAVSPPAPSAPDDIQRAATAAETTPTIAPQPTPVQSQTAVSLPTPSTPDAIQRAAAAAETFPTISPQSTPVQSQTAPTPSRSLPLVNTGGQAVSLPTSSAPDGIQRAVAAAETTLTIAPQPTPVQSQTAVSPSTPSEPDAIQRAVTAAETTPTIAPQSAPVQSQTAVSPSTPSASDSIQRAVAAAETNPTVTPQSTPVQSQTAVSPPAPSTPDIIQRAVTAAETIPTIAPQSTPVQSQTGVSPSTPSASDSIQRAVAAAETNPTVTPQSMPVQSQTAVSPRTPSTPDAIQRAVAAAETTPTIAPQSAPVQSQTAVSPSSEQAVFPSTPSASDSIQRAVAAAETTPTIAPQSTPVQSQTAVSLPTSSAPDTIQRAVAAAETTPTVTPQSTPVQSQTAVTFHAFAGTGTLRSLPLVNTGGQAVSPPTPPSAPDAIQRAVAVAETSSAKFTQRATVATKPQTAVTSHAFAETGTSRSLPLMKGGQAATFPREQAVAPPSRNSWVREQAVSSTLPTPSTPNDIQRAIAVAESVSNVNTAVRAAPIQPMAVEINSLQNLSDNIWRITPTQTSSDTATPAASNVLRRTPIKQGSSIDNIKEQPAYAADTINHDAPQQPQTNVAETMPTHPVVQRAELETDSMSDPELEIENVLDPTADDEDGMSDVDIEPLVHEVYSQIRRRLAVEWERGRGKR